MRVLKSQMIARSTIGRKEIVGRLQGSPKEIGYAWGENWDPGGGICPNIEKEGDSLVTCF